MALEEPKSMSECFYFTRRVLDNDGWAVAWVKRPIGPGGKPLEKPKNPKSGKVDKKATYYVEPDSDYQIDAKELEPTLTLQIKYKSPYDGSEGEAEIPFKLKTFMGVKAYVFECQSTGKKIGITKKMKDIKKK